MRLNHHHVGTGSPLVLVHGIGSRWQVWEPVLDLLAPHREVVAVDLPGFGASPMPPPGTPPGIDSLSSLLLGFLAELGLERPHLAGNSLGGWLSLELAARGRASSATALSPAGFHTRVESVYERTSLWLGFRGARLLAARADGVVSRPRLRKAVLGQYMAHPERMSTAQAAANLRGLAGSQWFDPTRRALLADRFEDGERIDVPVTIAWGEKDRLLLPHQAARAARAIPHASMVTLTGCGHVPTFDDPEQVARVLLEGSGSE